MTERSDAHQLTDRRGVPARDLPDEELERQGVQAHATRHWVFLHGTAEQFHNHTERMLELEQEYLRRHPHRTWQGSGHTGEQATGRGRDARIRDLIQTLSTEVLALLDEGAAAAGDTEAPASPQAARVALLAQFARAPEGKIHKLEAHQIARSIAPDARLVASLYTQEPPLLRAEGDQRVITDAGRAWLAEHTST